MGLPLGVNMTPMPDDLYKSLHRRSTRLAGYDYGSNGAYFLTICSHERRPLFCQILNGRLEASGIGAIVEQAWNRTATVRRGILLDSLVLMPNHLHAILVLNARNDDGKENKKRIGSFEAPASEVGSIVRGFKAAVTSAVVKQTPGLGGTVWQRGYHDRIVRSEEELEWFREYIANNPLKRELDQLFEQDA
jgi:REP element-mobilizing transposase RayT